MISMNNPDGISFINAVCTTTVIVRDMSIIRVTSIPTQISQSMRAEVFFTTIKG
jgi:hypothetical protein